MLSESLLQLSSHHSKEGQALETKQRIPSREDRVIHRLAEGWRQVIQKHRKQDHPHLLESFDSLIISLGNSKSSWYSLRAGHVLALS